MGDYPWEFMLGQRAGAASKMGRHTHTHTLKHIAGMLSNKDKDKVSAEEVKSCIVSCVCCTTQQTWMCQGCLVARVMKKYVSVHMEETN